MGGRGMDMKGLPEGLTCPERRSSTASGVRLTVLVHPSALLHLGQVVPRPAWAAFKVLPALLQPTDVKDLMELCHHTPDVRGRKPAVLHSADDMATAGVAAPRQGGQGSQ